MESIAGRRIRHPGLAWLGLIVLSVGVYLPTLQYDFVWDDHQFISGFRSFDKAAGGWNDLKSAVLETGHLTYRPLFLFSLRLDWALWGSNPAGFHLTNLVLHALVTLVAFGFVKEWSGSDRPAFFTAALFALHPVHAEAVAWISGRADLLTTLFSLLSIWAALRSAKADGPGKWAWLAATGIGLVLALLAKETAIVLPALAALIAYSCPRVRWRSMIPSIAVTAAIGVAYFLWRSSAVMAADARSWLNSGSAALQNAWGSPADTAFAMVYVTGEYLRLLLLPVSLKAVYTLPPFSLLDPTLAISILLLLGWMGGIFVLMGRSRLIFSAMGWVLISLLTAYALILYTSVSPVAERLAYLPSLGFAFFLADSLTRFDRSNPSSRGLLKTGPLVLLLLLAAYGLGTVMASRPWAQDESLWTHAVQKNPQSALARFNLGAEYLKQKRWGEALKEYERAVAIRPSYPEAHFNIGNILSAQGRRESAVEAYRSALRQRSDYADAYVNLGVTLYELGRPEQGFEALQMAVLHNPRNAVAHNNLANAYTLRGRWDEAVRHYEEALSLQPDYPEARMNLERALRFDDRGPIR